MTMTFGLVPSLVLVRRHAANDLKAGGRGSSRDRRALHQGLVIAEVALACALVVASALLVRTVGAMTRMPLGVAPKNVVLAGVQLSAGFTSGAWRPSPSSTRPSSSGSGSSQAFCRPAARTSSRWSTAGGTRSSRPIRRSPAPKTGRRCSTHSVSEGYFETMGATLVDGRAFTPHDTPESEAVVLVNQTLARRFYPGRSAVGREIVSTPAQVGPLGRNLTWTILPGGQRRPPARTRIVGVVADIQDVPLGSPVEPAVYAPTRQFPFGSVTIAVAARDRATAVQAVRSALKAVSPQTPVGLVESWDDRLASRTAEPRLLMTTLTTFGALAGFLAALGVYGLFSWSVALRRRELAIRLTLGARPAGVGASVLRRSLVLVAIGIVLGLALVQAGRGLLSAVLFGVTAHDATSLVERRGAAPRRGARRQPAAGLARDAGGPGRGPARGVSYFFTVGYVIPSCSR